MESSGFRDVVFSAHALEQMQRRGIPVDQIRAILRRPEEVLQVRAGRHVVQQIVTMGHSEREYLLRIFVDTDRTPAEVVTVYRTSKIAKYRRQS